LKANILHFWHKICHAGVQDTHDARYRIRLVSMNTLYACVVIMVVLYSITTLVKYDIIPFLACIISLILTVGLLYANYIRQYRIATWLHFLLSGMSAFVFSVLLGFNSGFYMYLLVTPISILLFVDRANKVDFYAAIAYYISIFFTALILHEKGLELLIPAIPTIYLIIINFFFTAIFILVLTLTFVKINELYFNEITEANAVLSTQRDEIAETNTILTQKNQEVNRLVRVLNDKVKNNLQIIGLFNDLDTLNPPTHNIGNLLLLQKSRVKVLDICYAMAFEDKTESSKWFSAFFERYYTFFKTNYTKNIAFDTTFDLIIPETTPNINRKRFEMLLLIINEWHFSLFDTLSQVSTLQMSTILLLTQNEEQPFHLKITVKGHSAMQPIINAKIDRLKQPKVRIAIDYDKATQCHIFEVFF
jgi:hypothetical protein